MKQRFIFLLFASFGLFCFTALPAATLTFTGAGDGTSWGDGANWDTGNVPTFMDDVIINGSNAVLINSGVASANSLRLANTASLTVMGPATLSMNSVSSNGNMIEMDNRSALTVNGSLVIIGGPDDQIHMHDRSLLTNNGLINLVNAGNEGIEMFDNSDGINNGQIFITDVGEEGFEMEDNTRFYNYGSMTIEANNDDEVLEMDGSARFFNYGQLYLSETICCDGICMNDSGTRFFNTGHISIDNVDSSGIEVDDGRFVNEASGTIQISNTTEEMNQSIEVESDGRFDNYGLITINHQAADADHRALELECDARLRNFNVITISMTGNPDAKAIDIDCSSGLLRNEACGVINMLTQNRIRIDGGTLRNEGVLATVFSGTHDNDGTLNNQNQITAPNGFTIAPNAVVGPGTISTTGAVPAQSACNILIGDIGCGGTTTYNPAQDMYTQTADGCFYAGNYTADQISYSFQELCGNGEIIARVAGFVGQGWAGVMMREDLTAGSKKISLMLNQSEVARREVRMSTNGPAFPQQFPAYGFTWVRLVRNGNYFQGFLSQNGVQWQFVMNQFVPMANCVNIGLVSTNYNDNNSTSTAMFDNVFFSNAPLVAPDVEVEQNITLNDTDKFSIYPNPTNGKVTIELNPEMSEEVDLQIMNATGQQVRTLNIIPAETPRQEVDLYGLPNGLYYFDLIDANGNRQTEKVILNGNQ